MKVDVIIPAGDEERHIGDCLAALREQSYPAELLRVIVVADGSRDRTAEIAARYEVMVLTQARRGPGAARNAALLAGNGELIASLDAHCIVERDWVAAMVDAFTDERLGAAQGTIENASDHSRVQRWLERTGALSNERLTQATVEGKGEFLPWVLSGNTVYRRRALEEAGNFETRLRSCEDVDMAWRILLRGYRLVAVPSARALHLDGNSPPAFIWKSFQYAQGAAQLLAAYRGLGAQSLRSFNRFSWKLGWEGLVMDALYRVGYRVGRMRCALGMLPTLPPRKLALPARAPFVWNDQHLFVINDGIIEWTISDGIMVVHLSKRERYLLTGVSAAIWSAWREGCTHAVTTTTLARRYGVSEQTVFADVEEFVAEASAAGLLVVIARKKSAAR